MKTASVDFAANYYFCRGEGNNFHLQNSCTQPEPRRIMSTQAQPTLKKGSHGPEVKRLQELLNQADRKKNFGNPPPLPVDGEFGPNTETAVKNFQNFMD
jgi:peptidoglycan hydrolase-like protein with peptidoglycan-binding domain